MLQEEAAVEYRVLRCRAIWLINMDMAPDDVITEAFGLLVENLQHPDLVVALQSVASLSAIFSRTSAELKVWPLHGTCQPALPDILGKIAVRYLHQHGRKKLDFVSAWGYEWFQSEAVNVSG